MSFINTVQYAPLNGRRQWPPLKTYRVREKISSGTSWNAFLSICRSNFWLSSERGSNKFWGHTLHGLIEELTMLPHQWGWPCCTNWHTHNQSRSFTCTPSVRRVKVNHIGCAEHDLAPAHTPYSPAFLLQRTRLNIRFTSQFLSLMLARHRQHLASVHGHR